MTTPILLEVCAESLQSAITAERSGADRVELNSALALGGLTPSLQLLEQVKSKLQIPVICMVRPRPGDFFYNDPEFDLIQQEAESLLNAGADGLAVGCLNSDGNIDQSRLERLRQICRQKELVVHRAFDCTADLVSSAQQLIDHGVNRVLTSGGAPTAILGQQKIAELESRFGDQLEILPGSGIKSTNVAEFVRTTGCRQVHGTFRAVETTGSTHPSTINFNELLGIAANEKLESSASEIQKVLEALSER